MRKFRVRIKSASLIACFLGALAFICVPSVFATTVAVGTCRPSLVSFTTIQAAVNASPVGGTVDVCPGSYPEQVVITRAVTIQGVNSGQLDAAEIIPPAGGVVANATSLSSGNAIAAQILIQGTAGANISHIVVDGTGNAINGCLPDLIGIYYQNASGIVSNASVKNQALGTVDDGCQNGLGIFVQSGSSLTSTVTVTNSTVYGYQKNGITGNEIGTTLIAKGNSVVGQGPTNGAAENGIQIGFGAAGQVLNNTVINDVWAPDTSSDPGDAAAGILVYAASGITITGNNVGTTQFGIALAGDPVSGEEATSKVETNRVSGTLIFDGIDVCGNGNTVETNIVNSSAEAGIHLDDICGGTGNSNTTIKNTINDACAGVLTGTATTGNVFTPNTYFDVTNILLAGDSCSPLSTSAPTTVQMATSATTTGKHKAVPYR